MNPQQRAEFSRRNPYTMDIDRRENRNCYVYRDFEYLARNCKNREMEMDNNNNLKEEQDLIVFD